MSQDARQITKKVFGEERMRMLSPDEKKQIQSQVERLVQERGREAAEAHIRKAKTTVEARNSDLGSKKDGQPDFYAMGAAALMMATINAALNPQIDQDPEMQDGTQGEEPEYAGSDDLNPFLVKDPRPSWA